jgi:hypothetical protein
MQAGWWAYGDGVEAPARRGRSGVWRWPVSAGSRGSILKRRSNAKQRQSQLDSLEAISRMTYFDMVNQALMLRQSPEEITISECLKALTT